MLFFPNGSPHAALYVFSWQQGSRGKFSVFMVTARQVELALRAGHVPNQIRTLMGAGRRSPDLPQADPITGPRASAQLFCQNYFLTKPQTLLPFETGATLGVRTTVGWSEAIRFRPLLPARLGYRAISGSQRARSVREAGEKAWLIGDELRGLRRQNLRSTSSGTRPRHGNGDPAIISTTTDSDLARVQSVRAAPRYTAQGLRIGFQTERGTGQDTSPIACNTCAPRRASGSCGGSLHEASCPTRPELLRVIDIAPRYFAAGAGGHETTRGRPASRLTFITIPIGAGHSRWRTGVGCQTDFPTSSGTPPSAIASLIGLIVNGVFADLRPPKWKDRIGRASRTSSQSDGPCRRPPPVVLRCPPCGSCRRNSLTEKQLPSKRGPDGAARFSKPTTLSLARGSASDRRR